MNPAGASTPAPARARRVLWASMVLVATVLASRAPFLDAGYGANIDSWRVAWARFHPR